jgi:hypothetical protein
MSRYETTLLPAHDALLTEVEQTLRDPELANIRLPESLHSNLYIGQPYYRRQLREGDVTEGLAKQRWVADVALTALWFYAVNRREDDPERMRRNDLVKMITQLDDPQITDVFVENEINILIDEHLVEQKPPLLDPSSIYQAEDYTLSLNFDRILFEGLREELEWRRLDQSHQTTDHHG